MPKNNSKARREQRRKDAEYRAENPDLEARAKREAALPPKREKA